MSGRTVKRPGWQPFPRPAENEDISAHRKLLIRIVKALFNKKRRMLAEMDMPSQPVSLLEIYQEYKTTTTMLKSIGKWPHKVHGKRWIDRRVNEIACPKFYSNRVPAVVAATAGQYEPNPQRSESRKLGT